MTGEICDEVTRPTRSDLTGLERDEPKTGLVHLTYPTDAVFGPPKLIHAVGSVRTTM